MKMSRLLRKAIEARKTMGKTELLSMSMGNFLVPGPPSAASLQWPPTVAHLSR
jgi:hypothetical protein